MNNNPSSPRNKSIGTLFPAVKTKERSPDMIGKIKIHVDLLKQLLDELNDFRAEYAKGNVAAWFYNGKGTPYQTVEISPLYQPRPKEADNRLSVEQFFVDVQKEQE
jgi:hypothetical protein